MPQRLFSPVSTPNPGLERNDLGTCGVGKALCEPILLFSTAASLSWEAFGSLERPKSAKTKNDKKKAKVSYF